MRLSHFGICVSDLDPSLRFYCEGLGFEVARSFTVGHEFGPLMELEGVRLDSRMIARDGVTIELLHFSSPPADGDRARRPLNRFGLTHLSFSVDDLDEAAVAIASAGGQVHAKTRIDFRRAKFVYCSDPDGVRIELMQLPV